MNEPERKVCSAPELRDLAIELERLDYERRKVRVRELVNGRDFNQLVIKPGTRGILISYPNDTPCDPNATDHSLTVDVDYTVNIPDENVVTTTSIEKLTLQWEWGAAEHVMQSDILRGTAGTFIGQRLILRYFYDRDVGSEQAPVTQPEVGIRASIVVGNVKASPSPSWNLRKTIFVVASLTAATESGFFQIPPWAICGGLQVPGAHFAGLALILNQYTAANGTLLSSGPIGQGDGATTPVAQGARFFTVQNVGPEAIPNVRVRWTLGQ